MSAVKCMKLRTCAVKIFFFICFFFYSSLSVCAFTIPEKFVYDLTWMGIKAGTATLEIVDNNGGLKIISTAQSASWVSIFYTVDDRIVSTLFKNEAFSVIGQPKSYRVKIREGRHRRDKEVVFDYKQKKATYFDYLKKKEKTYDIPSFVFDPLAGFYHLRTLDLSIGEQASVTIFDSKKVWDVDVEILRRETIKLPQGSFNTIVVKPVMKSEGIFFSKGDIFIWLTDDAKHIPVKMQTKVAVGYVNATLVQGIY